MHHQVAHKVPRQKECAHLCTQECKLTSNVFRIRNKPGHGVHHPIAVQQLSRLQECARQEHDQHLSVSSTAQQSGNTQKPMMAPVQAETSMLPPR